MSCPAFSGLHHHHRVQNFFKKTITDYEITIDADGRWQILGMREAPLLGRLVLEEAAKIGGFTHATMCPGMAEIGWTDELISGTWEDGVEAVGYQTFGRISPGRMAAAAADGVDWTPANAIALNSFCWKFGLVNSDSTKQQNVIAVTEFAQALGIELQPAWFASASGPDEQVVAQVQERLRQRSEAGIAALIQAAQQGQPWCEAQFEVLAGFGPLLMAAGRSIKWLPQLLSILGGTAGTQMELADVYERYTLAAAKEEPFRKQQLLAQGVATGPGPTVDQAIFDVHGLTDVTPALLSAPPRLVRLDTALVMNAPVNRLHFLCNKAGDRPASSVLAALRICNLICPDDSVMIGDICGFVSQEPLGGIGQLMEKHQPRQAVHRLSSLGDQGVRKVVLATGEASQPLKLGLEQQQRGFTIKVRGVRVSLLFAPPGGEDWMMIIVHAYHPFNAKTDNSRTLAKRVALAASIFTGRDITWPEVEAVLSAPVTVSAV